MQVHHHLTIIRRRNNRCTRLRRSRSSKCERVPYPHQVPRVRQQTSLYPDTSIRARSSVHSQQTLAVYLTNTVNPAFSSSFRICRFEPKVRRAQPLFPHSCFQGLGAVTNSIWGVCIYRPFSPQATTHERWRVGLTFIRTWHNPPTVLDTLMTTI